MGPGCAGESVSTRYWRLGAPGTAPRLPSVNGLRRHHPSGARHPSALRWRFGGSAMIVSNAILYGDTAQDTTRAASSRVEQA